MFKVNSALHR